jgi:hypothetical protein
MNDRGPFIDVDLLPAVSGLEAPTVGPHEYVLIDDDRKRCQVVSEGDLEASYVDNNIHTFKLDGVDWLTLAVDDESVNIVYTTGARTSFLLGSISLDWGKKATQYYKVNGVSYPIDDHGALLFNNTNTPRLVAMRTWYLAEAKRVNDERIKIAEVVHIFAGTIGALGTARGELP